MGATRTGRRHGSSAAEDWPTRWPTHSEHWPSIQPPPVWVPARYAVVTACVKGSGEAMQVIEWSDLTEAVEATRLLYSGPCSRGCRGEHLLVVADPATGVHARSLRPPPRRSSLARQLFDAGYRIPDGSPDRWPKPSILNTPLRGAAMTPEQLKADQDRLIGNGPNRRMEPHPGGLRRRMDAAIETASSSVDPCDRALTHALQAAWDAEQKSAGTP